MADDYGVFEVEKIVGNRYGIPCVQYPIRVFRVVAGGRIQYRVRCSKNVLVVIVQGSLGGKVSYSKMTLGSQKYTKQSPL